MSKPLLIAALTAVAVLGTAAARADEGAALAITANGTPVVELFRERDGSVRYQLNDDLAMGMSLGLSPIRLTDGANARGARWLPMFDLYEETRPPALHQPGPLARDARERRWFWTVGSHTNLVAGDAFDTTADLAQHFSLQTQAGFLIPLGRRWLLGGALTVDHVPDAAAENAPAEPRTEGTSIGAFLGLEFNY